MEETKKEELQEEERDVVIEGVEEFKPDGIDEKNLIDGKETPKDGDNSSSSSSSSDVESPVAPLNEESVEVVNLEKLEEEKGYYSVLKSVDIVPLSEELIPDAEVLVENTDVSDVTDLESKEIKEQILPSLDENNVSAAVTNMVLEGAMKENMFVSNGTMGESSDNVKLAFKENADAAELQLDENDVNSSGVVDLESKKNVDNLLQKAADVPGVDTNKMDERNVEVEIPESMVNQQPVISLAPRARHMTSWRNCCGLFDVLRRSNR